MFNEKLIQSGITIIIGIFLYFIINNVMLKLANRNKKSKGTTYIKLINNILKYVILFFTIIAVLKINGINVGSILAGLGIVTIVAGLALQDALKDIIMGFNIILDDYFKVGDVLKIDEVYGKVLQIGFKTVKMIDICNNNIFVIANRNIGQALVLSNQLDIDIPIPYTEKINNIENIINDILKEIQELNKVESCEYKGVNEFGESAIYYKIRIYTDPEHQPQIKRDSNRIIKLELDKNNIEIPFKQIDIHSK